MWATKMLNNTNQPRYHFYHSTVLDTILNQVWSEMRDLTKVLKIAKQDQVEDIHWFDGGSTEKIPSKLKFTVQPGNYLITEEVIGRNEIEHSLTYCTIGKALSLVDYVATFIFKPITEEPDKTFLEWAGDFCLTEEADASEFLSFYGHSREQQLVNLKAHFATYWHKI